MRLPGLNEIIEKKRKVFRGGADGYSVLKKGWGETIAWLAGAQGFQKTGGGVFTYLFREPDRRRDPSNFIAGGVKIIEDALQDAGLLEGDGWRNVTAIQPWWIADATRAGVTVFVGDRTLAFDEAVAMDDEAHNERKSR